jgi:hypothetical protein
VKEATETQEKLKARGAKAKQESKLAKEKYAKEKELKEKEAKQEQKDDISPAPPRVARISFTQAAKELCGDIKWLLALSKAGMLTVAASGAAVEIIDAHCVRAEEDEVTHRYALRVLAAMASGNCEMATHEWASA